MLRGQDCGETGKALCCDMRGKWRPLHRFCKISLLAEMSFLNSCVMSPVPPEEQSGYLCFCRIDFDHSCFNPSPVSPPTSSCKCNIELRRTNLKMEAFLVHFITLLLIATRCTKKHFKKQFDIKYIYRKHPHIFDFSVLEVTLCFQTPYWQRKVKISSISVLHWQYLHSRHHCVDCVNLCIAYSWWR